MGREMGLEGTGSKSVIYFTKVHQVDLMLK